MAHNEEHSWTFLQNSVERDEVEDALLDFESFSFLFALYLSSSGLLYLLEH